MPVMQNIAAVRGKNKATRHRQGQAELGRPSAWLRQSCAAAAGSGAERVPVEQALIRGEGSLTEVHIASQSARENIE